MANIYDTAYQLEKDLRENDSFVALEEAIKKVKSNPESLELLRKFRSGNEELQKKQASGEKPSEEEIQELQKLSMEFYSNKEISEMMEKERQLNIIIEDINRIIIGPLNELYNDL